VVSRQKKKKRKNDISVKQNRYHRRNKRRGQWRGGNYAQSMICMYENRIRKLVRNWLKRGQRGDKKEQ
jgi:hypothetical protein